MIELREHQIPAYTAWIAANRKAVIKSATGTGKTCIGLKSIQDLNCNVIIIVFTVPLQEQWAKEIKEKLGKTAALYGGGHKEIGEITVCVANSVRTKVLETELMIVDEIHHAFSPRNLLPIKRAKYKYFLGLSATPERADGAHEEIFKVAPICSEFSVEDAIQQEVISNFDLIPVPIEMSETTRAEYRDLSKKIKDGLAEFDYSLGRVQSASSHGNFKAGHVMKWISKRRQLMANCEEKKVAALNIIKNVKKGIVFSETIESIENISHGLSDFVIYHSNMNKGERNIALERFRNDENCIMLSARALEEGIDVPSCDSAILISGNSSKRQYLQRIGRVLRKGVDKRATIYELYLVGTKEEQYIKKRNIRGA